MTACSGGADGATACSWEAASSDKTDEGTACSWEADGVTACSLSADVVTTCSGYLTVQLFVENRFGLGQLNL